MQASQFFSVKQNYFYKNWKPIQHSFIKDAELKNTLHINGYAIRSLLTITQLKKLRELYANLHAIHAEKGGMFYSLYSRDLNYRKNVHDTIQEILRPTFETLFCDYKNVINTFITKAAGPESEFYVHQDTTALDEFAFSSLSLWIPLNDVTPHNGGLSVIKKTHWLLSPYRGVSFPFPFSGIESVVRTYLEPLEMKAGEVLIFDPRIIHHSFSNQSKEDRVAIVSGIFPVSAAFRTCFKDNSKADNPIEIYEHDDDYLLKYPQFFYNCHDRPVSGVVVDSISDDFPNLTEAQFQQFCDDNKIPIQHKVAENGSFCNMIAEPSGENLYDYSCEENQTKQKDRLFRQIKRLFS